jgi:hypothetical protein
MTCLSEELRKFFAQRKLSFLSKLMVKKGAQFMVIPICFLGLPRGEK